MLFTDILRKGVSPYHTANLVTEELEEKGFEELSLSENWSVKCGGRYYVKAFDRAVVAFTAGNSKNGEIRIVASHTDFPAFHIKPKPESIACGCLKTAVEPYGGMIDSTWLDRPLSIAGLVTVKGNDVMHPLSQLVNFEEPVAVIPNLAIHLNRDVNKGFAYDYSKTMLPICKTVEDSFDANGYLVLQLAEQIGVSVNDILTYDLFLYCAEQPVTVGFDSELLLSPRLDNLTSVSACVNAITDCRQESGLRAAVFYDNEEVGSLSKQGADSNLVSVILEKATLSLGLDRATYFDMLSSGLLLSCDVAHAVHPNFSEKYDTVNCAYLNRGVALKLNYKQKYPTDAKALAICEELCKKYTIPYQHYMNHAMLPGGSTIGADASSHLVMPAVDVGVPILAMHSAVETMGTEDQDALERLAKAVLCE